MPLLQLSSAGLKTENSWRVRGVDLSVSAGEIVTLIGPNGSGKSTTVQLALGLLKPSEGKAWQKKKLAVSYVPQKLTIDPALPLTVERFMRLTGALSDQEVEQALESNSIAQVRKRQVRELSGGQFQRVLMARALARKPDLLVLDEPAQNLDLAAEVDLYERIKRARDTMNCGILLISHDLHVVMAESDQVVCLNGHVCCSGTPTSVASSPEFAHLFGDRGSSALALYSHHHDHQHQPDGSLTKTTEATHAS